MSELFRLKEAEIANGSVINAEDLNAEFDQLLDESNAQDVRLNTVETGNISISGNKTFTEPVKLDELKENTVGAGILIESTKLQQGSIALNSRITIATVDTVNNYINTSVAHSLMTGTKLEVTTDDVLPSPLSIELSYYAYVVDSNSITLHLTESDANANINAVNLTTTGSGNHALLTDPANPDEGSLWYNQSEKRLKFRQGSSNKTVLIEGEANALPQYHIAGPAPVYYSSSSIKLFEGMSCRDTDNTFNIVLAADQIVDLSTTGENGLDAGAEAGSDWYYLYVIADSSEVNTPKGLFSSVNEADSGSITMPSGYDKKRQLPIAIRNDASSDIIPFSVLQWPNRTQIKYEVLQTEGAAATVGDTNVLDGGVATSYTNVSLSAFVPPISTLSTLRVQHAASSTPGTIYLKNAGAASDQFVFLQDSDRYAGQILPMETDSSQDVSYKVISGASCDISVWGFIVTEVI